MKTKKEMQLWNNDAYFISIDKSLIHLDVVYQFLSTKSYWAKNISKDLVKRSIDHSSFCFGVYKWNNDQTNEEQVGFARVISDCTTFAYLADVFILEEHRGLGLGKQLIQTILHHPEFKTLRRFMLTTLDAHELYTKFGFVPVNNPTTFMQISRQTYS